MSFTSINILLNSHLCSGKWECSYRYLTTKKGHGKGIGISKTHDNWWAQITTWKQLNVLDPSQSSNSGSIHLMEWIYSYQNQEHCLHQPSTNSGILQANVTAIFIAPSSLLHLLAWTTVQSSEPIPVTLLNNVPEIWQYNKNDE